MFTWLSKENVSELDISNELCSFSVLIRAPCFRLGWWCPQREAVSRSLSRPWTCCHAQPASWSPGPAPVRASQRQSPRPLDRPRPRSRSSIPSSGSTRRARSTPATPGGARCWGGAGAPRPRPPTHSPWPPVATHLPPRRRPWTFPSERGACLRALRVPLLISTPIPCGSTRHPWAGHHSLPRHHYHYQHHPHPLITFQSTLLLHTTDLLLTQGPPHPPLPLLPLQRPGLLRQLMRLQWLPSQPRPECHWPRLLPLSWPWPRGLRLPR